MLKTRFTLVPLFLFIFLVACDGQNSVINQTTPFVPTITALPTPTPMQTLLPPENSERIVLVKLDYEPTFEGYEAFYEEGRLPAFTLYSDGLVIYANEKVDPPIAMVAHLSRAEVEQIMKTLLEIGITDLVSHTNRCRSDNDCLWDASYTLIYFWRPELKFHNIKIYADYANDVDVFHQVTATLRNYMHPDAEPYIPESATLFITPSEFYKDWEAITWPISDSWLQVAPTSDALPQQISGDELTTLLAAVPQMDYFYFVHEESYYQGYLVPRLP